MTKQEFIDKVSDIAKNEGIELTKKDLGTLLDAAFSVAAETICVESKFAYPGFGTFNKKGRKARAGRNPQTGAEIQIPASNTVSFKPAPALKTLVQG